jgi:hypothetical protein
LLRYNLDVMHIEKNVMDNILDTTLDIKGKTKDNLEARKDLQEMGLRPTLHLFMAEKKEVYMPLACYMMSNEDKTDFLKVLRDVRVPDSYSSTIFQCIRLKEHTILGLKNHDNYVLMQQLLPIALRGSDLLSNVVKVLVDKFTFFRGICETTSIPEALDRLQGHVYITLCMMEHIFPPSFFTSMVHIVVHLVCEC